VPTFESGVFLPEVSDRGLELREVDDALLEHGDLGYLWVRIAGGNEVLEVLYVSVYGLLPLLLAHVVRVEPVRLPITEKVKKHENENNKGEINIIRWGPGRAGERGGKKEGGGAYFSAALKPLSSFDLWCRPGL